MHNIFSGGYDTDIAWPVGRLINLDLLGCLIKVSKYDKFSDVHVLLYGITGIIDNKDWLQKLSVGLILKLLLQKFQVSSYIQSVIIAS